MCPHHKVVCFTNLQLTTSFHLCSVNVDDVPDYLEVVTTPMDYGTVSERLEGGNYADLIASDDIAREDENSTMEEILLHVLCDIEQVHHNCLLYNRKGSSMYRIGDLHSSKWDAYFNQYITERLPDNVQRDLTHFRNSCEVELKEGSHHVRLKKAKVEREDMSSSPESYQKKRKASAPLEEVEMMMEEEDDDDVEEEHEHDDESDRDDEDVQYLTSAKNEEDPSDSSSKLLFTENQVRSLEHVFFSSAAKLRQEEYDASNARALFGSPSEREAPSSAVAATTSSPVVADTSGFPPPAQATSLVQPLSKVVGVSKSPDGRFVRSHTKLMHSLLLFLLISVFHTI